MTRRKTQEKSVTRDESSVQRRDDGLHLGKSMTVRSDDEE